MKTRRLAIPLQEEDVRGLNIGDVVYLDGQVYTAMSLFHIRAIDTDVLPPIDFKEMNVLLHAGPLMKRTEDRWIPLGIDPTSSLYLDKYGPGIISKLAIRAIIGKTTMGRETMGIMKKCGCIHLTVPGVMGNILASQAKRVVGVYDLEELGSNEATWIIELENAGPFIVDIDTYGNNLIHVRNNVIAEHLEEFYEKYGVRDFTYINVGV